MMLIKFDSQKFSSDVLGLQKSIGISDYTIQKQTGISAGSLDRLPDGKFRDINIILSIAVFLGLDINAYLTRQEVIKKKVTLIKALD